MPINNIAPISHSVIGAGKSAGAARGGDFSDLLTKAVQKVSDTQLAADDKLAMMASGKDVDIHTTMIVLQEADISIRTMVSVRDRVVEAYQQIMNMTV
jgi:flagellar hook-basal body complex protein FliE